MNTDLNSIKNYYDFRVDHKIRDFVEANPRIEAAIAALVEWAPPHPKRILEIGCGVGATTWRMSHIWPGAQVIGADVSPLSLEVAKKCFERPNLSYFEGLIVEGVLSGRFDYIVLMDVYEHIAKKDRVSLHAALRSLLSTSGRIFLSFPTPQHLADLRANQPEQIQPVDEDVTPESIIDLAEAVQVELLYYKAVGIWRYGDYAHAVIGKLPSLDIVIGRYPSASLMAALKSAVRGLFNTKKITTNANQLGIDVLDADLKSRCNIAVSRSRREHLMSAWKTSRAGD